MGQSGRYELKYIINEDRAVAVADFVQGFLRPSPHNGNGPVRGHPVISLYMDSPDFFLFRQAFTGHKNRMKLRIRFYDDEWQRPAFLEIKRRVSEVICKDRAMISREAVRCFLTGGWPSPSYWPSPSDLKKGKKQLDVYYRFWYFSQQIRAEGKLYISYIREIFEAPNDDELRVTFDRQVSATLYDGTGRLHLPARGFPPPADVPPYYLPNNGVVLELKYDERAPWWMYDMVRYFNLQRGAMCKYSASVDGLGIHWGKQPHPENEWDLMLDGYD